MLITMRISPCCRKHRNAEMKRGIRLMIGILFFPLALSAHDLQYQIGPEPSMVIYLFFADNSKFSYEHFEIFSPGEKTVFQKGFTDKLGRIALMPDKPGTWGIRTFSEDGHGAEVKVEVGPNQILKNYSRSLYDRYSRVFTGAGLIFGIFGFIIIMQQLKGKGVPRA
jgi:nickel transport protein